MSYQIDLTQPARYNRDGKPVAPQAHRIKALQYQGKPIDADARFVVVTNNYRASGGGSFPGLDGTNIVMDSPDENREALIRYLRSSASTTPGSSSTGSNTTGSNNGNINPSADNNWRILPIAGIKLRFESGAGAIIHLPRYPQIGRAHV